MALDFERADCCIAVRAPLTKPLKKCDIVVDLQPSQRCRAARWMRRTRSQAAARGSGGKLNVFAQFESRCRGAPPSAAVAQTFSIRGRISMAHRGFAFFIQKSMRFSSSFSKMGQVWFGAVSSQLCMLFMSLPHVLMYWHHMYLLPGPNAVPQVAKTASSIKTASQSMRSATIKVQNCLFAVSPYWAHTACAN